MHPAGKGLVVIPLFATITHNDKAVSHRKLLNTVGQMRRGVQEPSLNHRSGD